MVKIPYEGIMWGLHRVLVKGLLGCIQGFVTMAHVLFMTLHDRTLVVYIYMYMYIHIHVMHSSWSPLIFICDIEGHAGSMSSTERSFRLL